MTATLNTYIPLSSAYSPNSVNIVLFFIRECDIDNCKIHTVQREHKIFFLKFMS